MSQRDSNRQVPWQLVKPALFYGWKDILTYEKSVSLGILVLSFGFPPILFSWFILYGFERTMEDSIINGYGDLAIVCPSFQEGNSNE